MKEYINKDYINSLLEQHLNNWWGPEYYACSIIQDEINDAPNSEMICVYKCSICGELVYTEHFKFCPCCGQPMEEFDGRN